MSCDFGADAADAMDAVELTGAAWRKSSRSGSGGGHACVVIAFVGPAVAVRDFQGTERAALAFTSKAWSAFVASLR